MICIMNHHTRPAGFVADQVRAQGREPMVFTDQTSYYRSKYNKRLGANANFAGILQAPLSSDWKLLLHDDIEIQPNAFEVVDHILKFAPPSLVCFFHPTNKKYRSAWEAGQHVMKTYSNFWMPFTALHRDFIPGLLDFWKNETDQRTHSEDGLTTRYCSRKEIWAYAVLPAQAQHIGLDISTYGNPRQCGPNLRNSFTYGEPLDVYSIDWEFQFNNPFVDRKKNLNTDGLKL